MTVRNKASEAIVKGWETRRAQGWQNPAKGRVLGSATERFWSRVQKTDECWIWTAGATAEGYGEIRVDGVERYAHRLSYEWAKGSIPKGLTIDHLCRNPRCVNPDHLETVTRRENTLRGINPAAQNARKIACKYGHPLTEDNVYRYRNGRERRCRTCHRIAARQRDARSHEATL